MKGWFVGIAVVLFANSLVFAQGQTVLLDIKVFSTSKAGKVNSLLDSMRQEHSDKKTAANSTSLYTLDERQLAKFLKKLPKGKNASLVSSPRLAMQSGETVRLDMRENYRFPKNLVEQGDPNKELQTTATYKDYKLGGQMGFIPTFEPNSENMVLKVQYQTRQIACLDKRQVRRQEFEPPSITSHNLDTTICVPLNKIVVLPLSTVGSETIYLVVQSEIEAGQSW